MFSFFFFFLTILVGLDQYGEAVSALSMALKLKKNNKEIRDALQVATLKKKDNVCATIPLLTLLLMF